MSSMKVADLLKRLDQILEHGQLVLKTAYSTGGQYNINFVKSPEMAGFRSASLSFIARVFGEGHPHFKQFLQKTNNDFRNDAEEGIEILKAIRTEIAGGWLVSVKGLVAAELFADFLEMAGHLLDAGYKDPAAVMIGSVLEEHIRQLCLKMGLLVEEVRDGKTLPIKADRLNADLAKNEAYSRLDQKQITAWLDLRNNAAHGKYDAYNADQVKQFLSGATEFMTRVSL
jgi:hypothetical protein